MQALVLHIGTHSFIQQFPGSLALPCALQLSYSSASPALSDKTKFRRFFRVFPPESSFNPAKFDLLAKFGWRRVATINSAEEIFSRVRVTRGLARGARGASRGVCRGASRGATRGASPRGVCRGEPRGASRGATRGASPRGVCRGEPRGASRGASRGATRGPSWVAPGGTSRGASNGATRDTSKGVPKCAPRSASRGATRGASRRESKGRKQRLGFWSRVLFSRRVHLRSCFPRDPSLSSR